MGYLNGIQVTNFITTTAGSDTYSTHLDVLGKGGLHSGLSGLTELYSITQERRSFGMFAIVITDSNPTNVGTYQLQNIALGGVSDVLTDNSNWKKFTSGSNNGGSVPILYTEHFIYTGGTVSFNLNHTITQIVAVEQNEGDLQEGLQFNVLQPNTIQVLTATTAVYVDDRFNIKYFSSYISGATSGNTSGYAIMDKNGNVFPNRQFLQFSGATVQVIDDLSNNKTIVNILASTGNTSSVNYIGVSGISVNGNVISYTGSTSLPYTSGIGINQTGFSSNKISVDLSNYQSPNQILLSGQTSSIKLDSASGITIDSSDINFKGIQESKDFSSNYTDLSLINKGYLISRLNKLKYQLSFGLPYNTVFYVYDTKETIIDYRITSGLTSIQYSINNGVTYNNIALPLVFNDNTEVYYKVTYNPSNTFGNFLITGITSN